MPPSRRPIVLIADDNEDTREMYALFLGTVGYRVETAVDGQEAVLKARRLHPDIVVMDLHVPTSEGWNVLTKLQYDPNTAAIPVIVLTGHDFPKPAGLTAGVVSYLMKPCLPERLSNEIVQRLRPARRAVPPGNGE